MVVPFSVGLKYFSVAVLFSVSLRDLCGESFPRGARSKSSGE
jgi:hypothetical protein